MSPGIGILWICIGAAAGWLGSKVMGTFARPSVLGNISIGILGALAAGFGSEHLLAAALGDAAVFASLGGALLGSCLLLFGWQALSRPQM